MSPDIIDGKDDGFYRLKKDSERRKTLVNVLEKERSRICDHWYEIVLKDLPNNAETSLTKDHLFILMDCLREFLPEQSICPIKEAIAALEEEFDYDVSKVNHIQLALLKFQVHIL